jgi:hypothetical protein
MIRLPFWSLRLQTQLRQQPVDRNLTKTEPELSLDLFPNHSSGPENELKPELKRIFANHKGLDFLELLACTLWLFTRHFLAEKGCYPTFTVFCKPLVYSSPAQAKRFNNNFRTLIDERILPYVR